MPSWRVPVNGPETRECVTVGAQVARTMRSSRRHRYAPLGRPQRRLGQRIPRTATREDHADTTRKVSPYLGAPVRVANTRICRCPDVRGTSWRSSSRTSTSQSAVATTPTSCSWTAASTPEFAELTVPVVARIGPDIWRLARRTSGSAAMRARAYSAARAVQNWTFCTRPHDPPLRQAVGTESAIRRRAVPQQSATAGVQGGMPWRLDTPSTLPPDDLCVEQITPSRQVAGLAAPFLRLAYLPDRLGNAPSPGVAMARKHLISGDRPKAGQRLDRLGGVGGERRDLGAPGPGCHRVGGERVADEHGAQWRRSGARRCRGYGRESR